MAYYGMGRSPFGPFEWKGALAVGKSGSQDHHTVIEFKGNWYYFYHQDIPWDEKNRMGWYGHRRIMCYTKMQYNRDRTIKIVAPIAETINAGGPRYAAVDGDTFQWDLSYTSDDSQVDGVGVEISGTDDDTLYQSYRYGDRFGYNIPLSNGRYQVSLYFAELKFDAVGQRKFHVDLEGTRVISDLDVFAAVGKNAAYKKTQEIKLADNKLNNLFTAGVDKSMVSAIKVRRIESFWDRFRFFS